MTPDPWALLYVLAGFVASAGLDLVKGFLAQRAKQDDSAREADSELAKAMAELARVQSQHETRITGLEVGSNTDRAVLTKLVQDVGAVAAQLQTFFMLRGQNGLTERQAKALQLFADKAGL